MANIETLFETSGAESTIALGDFAFRFTGSSDLYEDDGRLPHASINFITAHDGFTLDDLVSYNEKHNEANGEDNRDGESYNRSWNCGAEGQTDDVEIIKLRSQQRRNFLATLMLSQGVPMILGGDEMGRTTQGGTTTPTVKITNCLGSTGTYSPPTKPYWTLPNSSSNSGGSSYFQPPSVVFRPRNPRLWYR